MRRTFLFLAASLAIETAALGQSDNPSSEIARAVAPVVDAIRRETEEQAKLPPTTSIRTLLERMGRRDQAGRIHINEINFASLSPEQGLQARQAIAKAMEPVDKENAATLKRILGERGWFTIDAYGQDASAAAFHIVQHSGDINLMKQVLPRLEPLAQKGEIEGFDFAAMYDRVAIKEGRPQRYGTQFHCVGGKIDSYPLEDSAKVEGLRVLLKLGQTYAQSVALHAGKPCA